MKKLWFNGKSSRDFGIYISGSGTFDAPELDVTTYEIPGNNGNLILSNGRYKNIQVAYPAFIRSNFGYNAARAREWLLAPQGYCRLSDDYHPYEFRLGKFEGPLNFDMRFMNRSGECTLSFNCKPQRFLTDGELARTFSAAGTLYNPTPFEAKPLIVVTCSGDGTVTIGSTTVELEDVASSITLDCEIQDAYNGTDNLNSCMTGEFPVLSEGSNVISFSGDVTGITITPRWWTL